jgi:hypothetical protein
MFEVNYTKDREEPDSDRWSRRRGVFGTSITDARLGLKMNERLVFEFKLRRTVTDTEDMPIFDDSLGEVTAFIEGPWVTVISELLQKVEQHQRALWEKRRAPRVQEKLREDMKRFGVE